MNSKSDYFDLQGKDLVLKSEWTLSHSAEITKEIEKLFTFDIETVNATEISKIDSWGAYFIKSKFLTSNQNAQLTEQQKKLIGFLSVPSEQIEKREKETALLSGLELLGKTVSNAVHEVASILIFIGQASIRFMKNFASPRSFRFHSIIRHIDETGIRATPIIGLLAILISMVISYQAATQLQKFGANIFTIDLTVISLLREMAVLVTAIMVAGRSGSAFAAEIGVMKLREEVDALRTIGMDPFEVLVLPRVIALMITLPILTFIADMVGLAGGGIISAALLHIPLDQYIDRVQTVAKPMMFFVGMIKAPVFAFIIAIIGTYQGMNVSGSAESVGKLTTVSVVQAIFLVIMADAIFSILFANMGI